MSLFDAVQAVANLRGRRIEFARYGVALIPKTAPERLVVREYLVPPQALENPELQRPLAPGRKPGEQANWLISSGVAFDTQASATYIPSTRRLIVRDTEEKLQEIQKQVETMWREYYAKHPPKKKSLR